MGKLSRVRHLKDLISHENLELVGVQETIKKQFSERELISLSPDVNFQWNYIPAKGHSGGILVGVRNNILEVERWDKGEFFVEAQVRNRLTNFRWSVIVVYGPANHDFSAAFLEELGKKCTESLLPVLIGGDFNLIRSDEDRSSGQGGQKC